MAAAAAAEASGSGSGGAADSYLGSLISLTSKSEIRYEGILFNINTEESSIGLRNVRSFGTEGRKKDGPQIPPSDKVYEYILFRGSDIKDLQVKSSPPVPPTPPVHSDPAIIQSHYSQPAFLSTSMPSVGSGAVADHNSHTAQAGFPRSTFQGGLPLYQPGGSFGAWGSPAHPNANGSGLPMPMYWQGFYGPSSGLPHVQQQPLIRPPGPPPGLPIPHSMQQQMQYPGMNVSLSTGSQNLTEIPSLLPPVSTSNNQSIMSPFQTALLPSELSSSLIPSKIPISSLPMTTSSANLPLGSSLTSSLDSSATLAPVSSKPQMVPAPTLPHQPMLQVSSKPLMVPASTLPHQPMLQSVPTIGGPSTSNLAETSVPLVTPEQLMQPGPSTVSLVQPLQARKDGEVLRPAPIEPLPLAPAPTTAPVLDRTPVPARSKAQAPILPSPTLLDQKMNGAAFQTRHGNRGFERGRGRGNGVSHSLTKFTEDFDFIAMNEKFKKDEVWGQLGRNNTQSRANEGTSNDGDADDALEEGDTVSSGVEVKPVYVKDDFFDSLSSNALDRETRHGRMRFSEQRKIDSETFGDVPNYRGWGGRGRGRGGRSRGGYYGRGYDYGGRGRGGRNMPNRAYY